MRPPACTSRARQYVPHPDPRGKPVEVASWRCTNTPTRLWHFPDGDRAFCASCEPFAGEPVTGWLS